MLCWTLWWCFLLLCSSFDGGYSGQVERHSSKLRFFLVTNVTLPLMGIQVRDDCFVWCGGGVFLIAVLLLFCGLGWRWQSLSEAETLRDISSPFVLVSPKSPFLFGLCMSLLAVVYFNRSPFQHCKQRWGQSLKCVRPSPPLYSSAPFRNSELFSSPEPSVAASSQFCWPKRCYLTALWFLLLLSLCSPLIGDGGPQMWASSIA